jgi:glycosyltransferase involved in cell wall biosynthesis
MMVLKLIVGLLSTCLYERSTFLKIGIEARPIRWSYGTGIGNYTHDLISKLAEIDLVNEYTFLWPDDNPQAWIPFSREYSFYFLPKDDEREALEMPYWLAQERIDVFHLTQNGFRIPEYFDCKIIVTIHDLIPYFLPEMVRSSFLKRFIHEMPYIVERADRIVTVSEASKADIVKIFQTDPARITVVPSAPSAAYQLLPREETRQKLRHQYGIKKPYILYVGGLNPRKNIHELIYAYSKIYRDLPGGQQLLIFGPNGQHLDRLKWLVRSLNLEEVVRFPGFVPSKDLPLFYNGADLFAYPSLYEGFGLPPIEAMACGTPVVTSNVSSLPEVVGDAAVQINPFDTLELANAIFHVLTDTTLRESLIQKGLTHCRQYNWTQIARQILMVYQEVVNGASSSRAVG